MSTVVGISLGPGPITTGTATMVSSTDTSASSSAGTDTTSPTQTSSSATPSSTWPGVTFGTISDLTTCQQTTITWTTENFTPDMESAQFSLVIAGLQDVNPGDPYTNLGTTTGSAGQWTWNQVNMPAGGYIVQGVAAGVFGESNGFIISNGSDTSCLVTNPATSASLPASTGSTAPIAVSGSSHSHAGAITGGVVGGLLALVLATLLAFFCRRRSRRSSQQRVPAPLPFATPKNARYTANTRHVPADSDSTIIANHSDEMLNPYKAEKLNSPTGGMPELSYAPQRRESARSAVSYASAQSGLGRQVENGSPEMYAMTQTASSNGVKRKAVPQYTGDGNVSAPDMHRSGSGNSSSNELHGPQLTHKTSFGDGRPMHYLVPDMPAASADD